MFKWKPPENRQLCFDKWWLFNCQLTGRWLTTNLVWCQMSCRKWCFMRLFVSIFGTECPHAIKHRGLCSNVDSSIGWTHLPIAVCTHTHTYIHKLCSNKQGLGLRWPFLVFSRCLVWSVSCHGFRPSCSSCSLMNIWTTSSRMWCLWRQPVKSSGKVRPSPSCCRSSSSLGTIWTLAPATDWHSASPCLTWARWSEGETCDTHPH